MKTIILYTTKYGSVKKAAEMLKNKLLGEVVLVNLSAESSPSLSEFNHVILGGSIYMGRVQKRLSDYISSNLEQLLKMKAGLFLCAGFTNDASMKKELKDAFPPDLYEHAAIKEILGYSFDFNKMGFFEKMIVKKLRGSNESIAEFNEAKIERFADIMNSQL